MKYMFKLFAVPMLLAINIAPTMALGAQRQIEVEGQHRSDAVIITQVTVGNQDIQCGLVADRTTLQPIVPFEWNEDWLQNTTLYLLNRTNKTIVFGQIGLWFPETGDGTPQRPMEVYNLTLGRLPDAAAVSVTTGKPLQQATTAQPISLAPGQTLQVHLSDYINQIRGSVAAVPFPNVTRVIVRRSSFVFDDGMRWAGEYSIPDPDHPGKWKNMPPAYFPGNGHLTWPPK
jgi:hypothetical protein